jgi:hypothetical protein
VDILKRTIAAIWICAAAVTPSPASAQISPGELSRPHAFLEGMRKCLECHELGAGPSEEKCLDCHKEIAVGINNRRGYHHRLVKVEKKACIDCHSEHAGRDFQLVHWPGGVNHFDHQQTGYDLVGKHAGLKCRDCHKPDYIREDIERFGDQVNASRTFLGLHTECLACHPDEHRGQLAHDCLACHTNDGWTPASGFTHAKTRFALTGKHRELPCVKCHPVVEKRDPAFPKSNEFVRYTGLSYSDCSPCHKDVHKGTYGPSCRTCHNTSGWHDIPASAFDHSKTRFPLAGRHAGLSCDKCHTPGAKKAPLAHERCTDCHADAHFGQFVARADGGMCESCHTVDGFTPSTFTAADHAATRFELKGAHMAQPCTACHPVVETAGGDSYRRYRIDDTACESCHRDPHFGQFSRSRRPKDCTACHGMDEWRPVTFDHDRDSSYRLEGQHRRVSCGGCHVEVTEGGNAFIRYKPIDPSCQTCHSAQVRRLDDN